MGKNAERRERRAASEAGVIPEIDSSYQIDAVHFEAIQRVIKRAEIEPQNIGLYGEAGSGKTSLGFQIGALRRSPTFVVEFAGKQTADECYGEAIGVDRNTGRVTYRPSRLVQGVETPNAVVVLNDIALLQSRTVQNGLNELLDPTTRRVCVEQLGREVRVADGVIIVGTWNVGARYTGASELSLQLIDRFRAGILLELPYPKADILAEIVKAKSGAGAGDARKLAQAATWLHSDALPIEVSTRALISAGKHVVAGATIGHALACTVLGDLDAAERARAFGIIDVRLRDLPEADREGWATPKLGEYRTLAQLQIGAADGTF